MFIRKTSNKTFWNNDNTVSDLLIILYHMLYIMYSQQILYFIILELVAVASHNLSLRKINSIYCITYDVMMM